MATILLYDSGSNFGEAKVMAKNIKKVKFRMKCFEVSQKMLNFVFRCCTTRCKP